MRFAYLLLIGVVILAGGCGGPRPQPADTTPFITPEQRARMPIEERDDPYVLMRLQTAPTRPARR
jgi:hypothetical protein